MHSQSLHLVSFEEIPISYDPPENVAQTKNPNQRSFLPRWSSPFSSFCYDVFILYDDEAVNSAFSDVGEDRGERVGRSAGDDSGEI